LKTQGIGVNEIARRLDIRKATIITWLKSDTYEEGRGWKLGKRTHTDEEEARIVTIKEEMIKEKRYFLGAPYVRMRYAKSYTNNPTPSLWFVDDVVRRHRLQTHEPKQRTKGMDIVKRLRFPIRSIIGLGRIQQAADFIGKKYIAGRSEPVNVFSTSYYQWLKLYQIWRVLAETAECAIGRLTNLWMTTPIADVTRIDNGMTFRGGGRTEAHLGRFLKFLLNVGSIPLFSAVHQSYTNPHIEGHNRTFTEKLWTKHHFTSEEEIDQECARFNAESREYYEFTFKERLAQSSMRYLHKNQTIKTDVLRSTKGKKICFIRFVERWKEEQRKSGIVVLNRFISIPESYANQYVFAKLDLETATLHVEEEHEGVSAEILQQPFPYTH
jgi:hypothetical protein